MSRTRSGDSRIDMGALAFMSASIVLGTVGQVLLKAGAGTGLQSTSMGLIATLSAALVRPTAIAGLVAYAVSALLWLVVLSRVPLSIAYPMGASAYALVALAAVAMGEVLPPMRWAGVALLVAGVVLVGGGRRVDPRAESAES